MNELRRSSCWPLCRGFAQNDYAVPSMEQFEIIRVWFFGSDEQLGIVFAYSPGMVCILCRVFAQHFLGFRVLWRILSLELLYVHLLFQAFFPTTRRLGIRLVSSCVILSCTHKKKNIKSTKYTIGSCHDATFSRSFLEICKILAKSTQT